MCAADAAFTQRMTDSDEVELIGGGEIYRPVCRKCFIEGEAAKVKNLNRKVR
jgi:Thymidine kinase